MRPYHEALKIVLAHAPLMVAIDRHPKEARGYVAAANMQSPEKLPGFANSAMDGFAIRMIDIENASKAAPVSLEVIGTLFAGDRVNEHTLAPNTAFEIMTGASIPKGADVVIKREDVNILETTDEVPTKIACYTPASSGLNIRYPGEDFEENAPVIAKGQKIAPRHVMALSALGIDRVFVFQKPKVAIISTGKELQSGAVALSMGQIRDSNGPFLDSMQTLIGLAPCYSDCVTDNEKDFLMLLENIIQKDNPEVIISTGAVSQGRMDYIPDALVKHGANVLFHGVKLKPGKPVIFARLRNGCYYFGLPGNPSAVAVGWRFFVYPFLSAMQGLPPEKPLVAELDDLDKVKVKNDFVGFFKGHLYWREDARLGVEILKGQEAFKIHSLLAANCWIKNQKEIPGSPNAVSVYPFLDSGFFF